MLNLHLPNKQIDCSNFLKWFERTWFLTCQSASSDPERQIVLLRPGEFLRSSQPGEPFRQLLHLLTHLWWWDRHLRAPLGASWVTPTYTINITTWLGGSSGLPIRHILPTQYKTDKSTWWYFQQYALYCLKSWWWHFFALICSSAQSCKYQLWILILGCYDSYPNSM